LEPTLKAIQENPRESRKVFFIRLF